jgi:hypothetical protein
MVSTSYRRRRLFLQHAVQGWCPPVPIFRRLGIRTQTKIDHERYALKVLRGDIKKIKGDGNDRPADALKAARIDALSLCLSQAHIERDAR